MKDLARSVVGSDEGMRPNDPDHVRKVLNALCARAEGDADEHVRSLREISERECAEDRVDFLRIFWAARSGGCTRAFRGSGSDGVRRFGVFARR